MQSYERNVAYFKALEAKTEQLESQVAPALPDGTPAPPINQRIAELVGTSTPEAEDLPTNIGGLRTLLRTMLGQRSMPTGTNWRMSANRSATRLDAHDDRLDAVEPIAEAAYTYATVGGPEAMQAFMAAIDTMLTQQADAFTAALQTQGQAFNASLDKARTDLHAEILGTAGPLLETIKQIQALEVSENAEEQTIHDQLFALLGQQTQQLTQLASTTTALGNTQATIQANVTSLQTATSAQATDVLSLKNTATTLQTTLTAVSGKADNTATSLATTQSNLTTLQTTVTAVGGKADATAASLATTQSNLTTLGSTVAGHTTDISGLKTTATAQGTDIAGLKTATTNQAADITAMKAVDTGLRTDLTTAQATATALRTDLSAAQATSTGIRTDLTTAQGTLATQAGQIQTLQAIPSITFRDTTNVNNLPVKMWHGTGVTDSTGKVTVNLPAGLFTKIYDPIPTVIRAATNATQYTNAFIQSASTTQVVVQVSESKSTQVLILNTMIEGLEAAPAGVTVNLLVYGI